MADNTSITPGTGEVVRDKDRAGVKTQILGIDVGIGTATEALMSATNPMPVQVTAGDPDTTASGTITTTDLVVGAPAGAGALLSGTSTAGSYVAMALPGGDSAWNVQVTGLTTGTLYFEESLDSTTGVNGNWVAVNGRQTGVVNTVLSNNATTNGVWRGNTSGVTYVRIRSVGTLTGTPAIVLRASTGTGAVFLNASTPAGSNAIGSVTYTRPTAQTLAVSAATPVTGAGLDVSTAASVAFTVKNTVAGTPYVGNLSVTFEQSEDNTSWAPLLVQTGNSGPALGATSVAPPAANASTVYVANVIGVNWVRSRVTTAPTTNGATIVTTPSVAPSTPTVTLTSSAVTATPPNPTTTVNSVNSAATTNATSVRAAAGNLYAVAVSNSGAAAAFVKLYNKATAPTVGTDTPMLTIPVAASGVVNLQFGALGFRYATGLALAITNLVADTDTTAVAANQVKVLISYT